MIKHYSEGIRISVQKYKSSNENQGKVAIFDFDNSELVAEGKTAWIGLNLRFSAKS